MKNQIVKAMILGLISVMLVGCGNSKNVDNLNDTIKEVVESEKSTETKETKETKETTISEDKTKEEVVIAYPTMGEIDYYFEDSIRYEEPVAVFGYKNNSKFTIVRLDLLFKMKEDITQEQLIVFDSLKDKSELSDDDILNLEPSVYDYIVCDAGEDVVGATCYMSYNLEPINAEQCKYMDLNYADIYFIAHDNKIHRVKYNAENDTYVLADETIEPYNWSDSEYANMIPKPDTRILELDYDEVDYFQCSAYDMSFEDFQAYMEKCEKNGFSWYEDNTTSCWANNKEGYELHVRYLDDMKMMEISLEMGD